MSKLLKNKFLVVSIVIFVVVAGYRYYKTKNKQIYQGKGLWSSYKMTSMDIEGKSYQLVVADNPARWTQGLMYVRKPVKEFDGMIFNFPNKQMQTFWNENTFVPLTLYWLADGKVIGKSDLPSIEESKEIVTVQSPAPADGVAEIIK
ncbi:hypothetical protein BH09PAT2_BH09PAT2_01790 [soil metagenome]